MNSGALNMGAAAQRFETARRSRHWRLRQVCEGGRTADKHCQHLTGRGRGRCARASSSTTPSQDCRYGCGCTHHPIENAKKEAGLSKQMLADIERIVAQLKLAETQSLHYLEGVEQDPVERVRAVRYAAHRAGPQAVGETDRQLGGECSSSPASSRSSAPPCLAQEGLSDVCEHRLQAW